ncbi:hypothetical protein ARMGADRAFT_1070436 [Armillaria gallica]|uniref:Uncharacterized protein n=1 Tax=Armillaria gallica TaxID=47427 RepID=A0A2H3ECB4_ARMGA|nr:hypothetical protein ARMGADRAFT_1070436 [Armillaria gallica]
MTVELFQQHRVKTDPEKNSGMVDEYELLGVSTCIAVRLILVVPLDGLSFRRTESRQYEFSEKTTVNIPWNRSNTLDDDPHNHQNIPLPSLSLLPPTHGRSLACFPSSPSRFSEFPSAQIYCIETVLQVWEPLLCKVQTEESSYWEEHRRGSVRVFGCGELLQGDGRPDGPQGEF